MSMFSENFNWPKFLGVKKQPSNKYGFADDNSFERKDPIIGDEPCIQTGYQLSIGDETTLDNWNNEHKPKCKFYDDGTQASSPIGAIGGRLTYSFTPTGLGIITTINCACGESVDVTDYDKW